MLKKTVEKPIWHIRIYFFIKTVSQEKSGGHLQIMNIIELADGEMLSRPPLSRSNLLFLKCLFLMGNFLLLYNKQLLMPTGTLLLNTNNS